MNGMVTVEGAEEMLVQAMADLRRRLYSTDGEDARHELRRQIGSLRDVLVSLVENFPVPDEDQILRVRTATTALGPRVVS